MLGETYQVILDNLDDDPTTYEEALKDVDVQEWKRVTDHEIESMGSNSIWSLIEAPKGVKPIVSKLIYKKKSLGKPCVHKRFKYSDSLILYVVDILLIGDIVNVLSDVRGYLK